MKRQSFANKLKHQISLLSLENAAEEQWSQQFSIFAEVKNPAQRALRFIDGVEFGSLLERSCMIFTCRYTPKINKAMRISFKERLFQIRKIINVDEQDQYLQIIALEL